jgi:hypothetical protein
MLNVFLSYHWRDHDAAEKLAHALKERGLNPFLDRWYLVPGICATGAHPKQSKFSLGGSWSAAAAYEKARQARRGTGPSVFAEMIGTKPIGGVGQYCEQLPYFFELYAG